MVKSGWVRVLVVVLVTTAVVSCSKPDIEEELEFSPTEDPPPSILPTETDSHESSVTTPTQPQPTNSPPPLPTAAPTTAQFSNWQQVGSNATGLQILAPPDWINLSGQLDTPATANQLGLIVLLLADSARTGESLLSGKPIDSGAYVAGLVSHRDLPPNSPQTALLQLLEQSNKSFTPLNEPAPITAFTASGNRLTGAFVDVLGDSFLFTGSEQQNLRTRVLLFTSTLGGAVNQNTQALFLMSAPESDWATSSNTFTEIAKTLVIHNIDSELTIRDGAANVVGELTEMDVVNGHLQAGVRDVWTFNIEEQRYATLTLQPGAAILDLTMTLISPSGQTVALVDNGFANDVETAVDQLLLESGLYVIEVGEFFNQDGPYTLSIVLTEEPLFGGGGDMRIGQTMASELPASGEHVWRFEADAATLVSVVLDPADFDAVLEIYAPDGRQLAALDEGFNGDAEVVSGLELPLTGEYTIHVRSFTGDAGQYTLSLNEGGDSTLNFHDAGDLNFDETHQETLQANEAQAWFFNGRSGDPILIEVIPLSEQLDLDIWLLDPNVERLTAVDKSLTGQAEYLRFTLPQDGQYLILVRDYFGEPGQYEITLSKLADVAPAEAGMIYYGDSVTADLAEQQGVVWWFDGRAGDNISILLHATDPQQDLRLLLTNPAGGQVLKVDQAGEGQPEQITSFTLPVDGRWGIIVESFFGDPGSYTLTLSQNP